MHVLFSNELGRIDMGNRRSSVFRLLTISGLGTMGKEYNVVRYAGEAGQQTASEKDMARTITLNGDVVRCGAVQQELSRMMRILYRPGELMIQAGNRRRKIRCRCTTVDEPVRKGPYMANITLQFTCDSPYFTDEEAVDAPLYGREDVVKSGVKFALPSIFTIRTSRTMVVNRGDVKAEPVFTLTNVGQSAANMTADMDTPGIELLNHTTGQRLKLECHTQVGEIITVDIPNRRVESDMSGSLLASLSADSFLSDFWLDVGANDIEVVNWNPGEDIRMMCSYSNQYVEAVY